MKTTGAAGKIKSILLAYLLALGFIPTALQAAVVKEQTIHRYSEITQILTEFVKEQGIHESELLVASDWDDVVEINDLIDPKTIETIHLLTDKQYKYMFITSRGEGRVNDDFEISKTDYKDLAEEFEGKLISPDSRKPLRKESFLKLFTEPQTLQPGLTYQSGNSSYSVTWVLYSNFFFAGVPRKAKSLNGEALPQSLKGTALTQVVDDEHFATRKPKAIAFIDDQDYNHDSVRAAFKGSDKKVILLHFQFKQNKKTRPPGLVDLLQQRPHWLYNIVEDAMKRTPAAVDHVLDHIVDPAAGPDLNPWVNPGSSQLNSKPSKSTKKDKFPGK